jgi:hypothetical protein
MEVRSTERLLCPDGRDCPCGSDTLKFSEDLTEARLEAGDRDNECARLATPFSPKASSQRVRAAGLSGVFGARRKDAVFSVVESWCFVETIKAGCCNQNPAKTNRDIYETDWGMQALFQEIFASAASVVPLLLRAPAGRGGHCCAVLHFLENSGKNSD